MPAHNDYYAELLSWVWYGLKTQTILLLPEVADDLVDLAGSWDRLKDQAFGKRGVSKAVMEKFREACMLEKSVEGCEDWVPPTWEEVMGVLRRFLDWRVANHGEPKSKVEQPKSVKITPPVKLLLEEVK